MIAALKILFQTRRTYNYLDEKYEGDLETNCSLIFGLLGGISGLSAFFKEKIHFTEFPNSGFSIICLIIAIAFGIVFGVLFGKYILTYILYGISRLLKGSSKLINNRLIAAYSLVPKFLLFPMILFMNIRGWDNIPYYVYWIFDLISVLVWFWILKIMVQGIMRFNKFNLLRSLINISPIILLGLLSIIIKIIRYANVPI